MRVKTDQRTACLPILTYHSVDGSGSVISTPVDVFANQMSLLAAAGYRGLTLTEAWSQREAKTAHAERPLAITFDDGFASVCREALPVLEALGFRATVFLVTGHIGGSSAWIGAGEGIPSMPLLSHAQITRLLEAGWELGGHSVTHPRLTALEDCELERELEQCSAGVQALSRQTAAWFAYPYGEFDRRVRKRVKRHFAGACSTSLAFAGPGSDPFALERIDMYYLKPDFWLRAFDSRRLRIYLALRRWMRAARGTRARRRN